MTTDPAALAPSLVEAVLERLGFTAPPAPDLDGLNSVYSTWCQRVPFDNVHKLIHLRAEDPAPLPGSEPSDVLEAWLEHGTGSTCWAGSAALTEFLWALGFDAKRVLATILFAPDLPPNHGSTVVAFDGANYLVDSSMLHGEPLRLDPDARTGVDHPGWAIRAWCAAGTHMLSVRALLMPQPMDTRIDLIGATHEKYLERYEDTRAWGPFNYGLSVRKSVGDRVIGTAWGEHIEIDEGGEWHKHAFEPGERARWLVEDVGLSEEIVAKLPEDLPMPPPPNFDPVSSE